MQTSCPYQAIFFDPSLSIILVILIYVLPDYYLFHFSCSQEFIFCLFAVIIYVFKEGYRITFEASVLTAKQFPILFLYITSFQTVLWPVL